MAKENEAGSGEVSKSDEIRKLMQEHPKAKAKEIKAMLDERGIDVSVNLIYVLMKSAGAKRRKAKREKVTQVVVSGGHLGDPVVLIRKVKALAEEVGSLAKLKNLVDELA